MHKERGGKASTPLVVHTTPGNVRDDVPVPRILEKLDVCGLERPVHSLHGDAAYGFEWTIRQVDAAGHEPVLAERDLPAWMHGSGLGVIRRVVEQTLAHFGHFRRIKICYESVADTSKPSTTWPPRGCAGNAFSTTRPGCETGS
jgi:hypothetical protein